MKTCNNRLNRTETTATSELVTVRENIVDEPGHFHAPVIPPELLPPDLAVVTNVRNFAVFESTVLLPSLVREKV